MRDLNHRIAAATRRCQRIAARRNIEEARRDALLTTDPNYWALTDIIDSLEIRFVEAQRVLHDLQARREIKKKSQGA